MQRAQHMPRVYLAASNSQPQPPPPPPHLSPMDLSHEFLMFQHGKHSTNEKLEFYQNLIMTLLVELKTLREAICTPCKQKWTASSASTSRSSTTSNNIFHPQHAVLHYSLYFILTFFTWFVDLSNWPGCARTCCFSFLVSIFLYYWAQTPRVYPATPVSELPPSPIDFSYDFLMFQHANHDTKEKLEFYQTFIMNLLGELKTLRETICTSCKQKYASLKDTRHGNLSLAAANDSIRQLNQLHAEHNTHVLLWWSPPFEFNSPQINASESSLLSTKRRNESDKPKCYAKRDGLSDTTLDVTFVRSFHHRNYVYCVGFSHDGRYLAVSSGKDDKDGSIVIYEVASHKKYCELREYASQYGSYIRPRPWDLCFSADGRYLAVVDFLGRMIIWDVPHKRIRSIFHGSAEFSEVHFSPDGRLVTFRTDAGLVVFNMRDTSRKMESEGSLFDFDPNGRYIATGNGKVVVILDLRSGKAVKRWNGHEKYLSCVKYTLDGRGLLCVYDGRVEQWDLSDAEPVLIRKFNIRPYFSRTSFSPDHRLLAFVNELWDVNSGKRQYAFKGHNTILSVDFSPAGTYLVMGDEDGFVSLWRYSWTHGQQDVSPSTSDASL